ncbi:MAG: hypothetical protein AB8C02_01625 [Halioglobus sp.]
MISQRSLPTETRRVWRLAFGAGFATLVSYALMPDFAYLFVLLSVFIMLPPRPPPAFADLVKLLLVLVLSTLWGMALGILLSWIPALGLLLFFVGMTITLRFGLARPEMGVVSMLFIVGQTIIAAISMRSAQLGLVMMLVMLSAFVFAFLVAWLSYVFLLREDTVGEVQQPLPVTHTWVSLRAALVILPPFLAVLHDLFFIPLLIKGSFLAQQTNTKGAWQQARELLLATLIGSVATVVLWNILSLWPNLLFLSLCIAFAVYVIAGYLYGAWKSRFDFAFWQNVLVTMLILVGPAVQDPAFGNDVQQAMWIRIGLFFAVSLYTVLAVQLLDAVHGWTSRGRMFTTA